MDDISRTRALIEQLNVGVLKYLEKKTGICKIELEPRRPADRHNVLQWEQKNTCFLPEDMKNFYLTSDGFQLTWCSKIDNGPIPVGRMYLNRVSQLTRMGGAQPTSFVNPSLADMDESDTEDETSGLEKPTFDHRCKIFELDPCDGYGKVCLVYRESKMESSMDLDTGGNEPKVEVWFLDRALRWHYLTDSFQAYYRLMLMHLGLPQWQYAFTDIGLSQQAKQWFNMYAPLRQELDAEISLSHAISESGSATIQLDAGKVFKGKADNKKKPVPAQTQSQQSQSLRKKPVVGSAKTPTQGGLKTSGSSSQLSNKGK